MIINDGASEDENIQGCCTIDLPKEGSHDQLMFQKWFELKDASGNKSSGRIRLGMQYIHDPVRLFETLIKMKEEEHKVLSDELGKSDQVFKKTSGKSLFCHVIIFSLAPFESLVYPDEEQLEGNEKKEGLISWELPPVITGTFATVQTAIGSKVAIAEKILEFQVKNIAIGKMDWATITQISALIYMFLSTIALFSREDFINVYFN